MLPPVSLEQFRGSDQFDRDRFEPWQDSLKVILDMGRCGYNNNLFKSGFTAFPDISSSIGLTGLNLKGNLLAIAIGHNINCLATTDRDFPGYVVAVS